MAGIADTLQQLLDPSRVNGISNVIGASPQQTRSAIDAAIPLLLGQLSRNAATPEGAASLQHAVARDHSGGMDLGGLLGGLVSAIGGASSNAGSTGGLADGAAILGHIFGNKQARVNDGVSQASGLNMAQVSSLLAMLAPLVMRALGQQQGAQTGGLGSILGAEAQQTGATGSGGLLGALLDRDGDGKVDLSDVLKSGSLLGGLFGKR